MRVFLIVEARGFGSAEISILEVVWGYIPLPVESATFFLAKRAIFESSKKGLVAPQWSFF